ncbi:MAG TPA: hypothetical protein VEU52_02025 [Candidatus Limnocylindrales bacterium]|nr:hypothetical protein [Candidatus Limnocylindrales bacterium]
MRLRIVGYLIGFAFVVSSGLMYARAVAWERTHNPRPLTFPISLEPGMIETPDIKIDMSRDYDIAVDFEQNRLHQVGSIDITWALYEGSKQVAKGNSVDKPWQNWGGTLERTLGSFSGQAGHRYNLVLQVNPGTTNLNFANPSLNVQVPRGLWVDYTSGLFFQKLPSYVMGAVGLLIVVVMLLSAVLPRLRLYTRPTSKDA